MSPIEVFAIPKSRIIGAMRRLFSMSPQHKHVKNRNVVDDVGPRGGKMVRCDGCGGIFAYSKCQVDHIEDVIDPNRSASEMSLDEIARRMWCPVSNLQVLCKDCHDTKSKETNALRRANKKARKGEQCK